eukprot:267387-Amorphochlora_amoeboformis.AAC.3
MKNPIKTAGKRVPDTESCKGKTSEGRGRDGESGAKKGEGESGAKKGEGESGAKKERERSRAEKRREDTMRTLGISVCEWCKK